MRPSFEMKCSQFNFIVYKYIYIGLKQSNSPKTKGILPLNLWNYFLFSDLLLHLWPHFQHRGKITLKYKHSQKSLGNQIVKQKARKNTEIYGYLQDCFENQEIEVVSI